jgi:hypothetical protein|tara:strand:- start:102 stop:803 length:702 start_codon:yes stop_codon:yes gene_type:complete
MALPKLESQVYELEQPSTGKKIKYRPFLVKEQKVLMVASESEDEKQIRDALAGIISSCTYEKVDPFNVPMFDVEFLFLRIRGKSVGEKIELNLLCPDDNETRVKTNLNLDDVGVNQKLGHTNEISITDKIKIIMNYPTLNDMISGNITGIDEVFDMIKRCVHEIHDGETVHNKIDMSESDLDEFIESLTTEQFQGLSDFFDTMPKVAHSIEVTNPKTKKKGEVVIEGIQSFFD